MSDSPRFLPAPRSAGDSQAAWPWGWLVATLLLAATLVGVHAVIDPAAYDVSQLPRLLTAMALLLAAAPALLLVPSVAQRLDWRPLGDPLVGAAQRAPDLASESRPSAAGRNSHCLARMIRARDCSGGSCPMSSVGLP